MNWNEIFEYRDGHLYWIKTRQGVKLGCPAGSKHSNGYIRLRYNYSYLLAHRVIWEMHKGSIPEGMEVDHINHVRNDNRIENLRIVTHKNNQMNQRLNRNNISGCSGVRWSKRDGKWYSRPEVNGKSFYLGSFNSKEEAIEVTRMFYKDNGFHENHGR